MDLGVYYTIPIAKWERWTHELSFGFEHKRSESHLTIGGISDEKVGQSVTEVNQLTAQYEGSAYDDFGSTSFRVNGYYSPGEISGANTPVAFSRARRGSDPEYRYLNFELTRTTNLLWGVYLRHEASYQMTSGSVLGSEQFGLGGWNTVRGYDEREVSTDEGWLLRQEIWSPKFSLGDWMTQAQWGDFSWAKDSAQGYLFWDYGVGWNRTLAAGDSIHTDLSGLGFGVRYQIQNYITMRADYGFQLVDTLFNKRHNGRFHIGIMISY